MRLLASFIAGLIFSAGLLLSGMANPAKVLNFLDFAGTWDPSLIFVMAGAVLVTTIGYRLVFKRVKPVLDQAFHLPSAKDVDASLLFGAAMFGIGWGMVGFCPGPAVVSLPFGNSTTLVFVIAMLAGIIAANLARKRAPAKDTLADT